VRADPEPRTTPEERELRKKRAELATVQGELAERELELVTLQNELNAIDARYHRTIGSLYAELDDIEAQIVEAQSQGRPANEDLRTKASGARAKATQSADSVARVLQKANVDFAPADSLKSLYREIARLLHPDLTTDDVERARRDRLMMAVNDAYATGDELKLRAILDEWLSSPDSIEGEDIGAELIRTIRKIHQAQRRLAEIETQIAALKRTDLWVLKSSIDVSKAQNRDLFEEMAEELNRQIESARMRLGRYRNEGSY